MLELPALRFVAAAAPAGGGDAAGGGQPGAVEGEWWGEGGVQLNSLQYRVCPPWEQVEGVEGDESGADGSGQECGGAWRGGFRNLRTLHTDR